MKDWDTTPKPQTTHDDLIVAMRDAGLGYDRANKTAAIISLRKFERWRKLAIDRYAQRALQTIKT